AIRRFVEWNDHVHDPDDVVQEVYLKLVEIIRSGTYNPDKARFRTFLAILIRRQLITLYRQDQARHVADRCSIDDLTEELAVPAEQQMQVDLNWAKAKHEAAVEHVLTKVAMKQQSRDIYRAYVIENRSIDDISATFGVSAEVIYKVKNRVNKMIEAVEMEYAEEKI
ncbi:MAG: sigma-70 family RNA polymerase sigma factor, partial [Paludibacteraceae bacterium]|nr:sigma-70 family RNA polymerase sigma factor [Paludibacteraceae bacterium]